MKILLDTDLGDDIDDAWALATCLGHPGIDLVGVTTVFRDTQLRAAQTRKLLELAGRADIPVAAGSRDMLDRICPLERNNQAAILGEDEARLLEGRTDGVRMLAEMAEANPGATLLTIGALTNAARLIVEFPQAFDKLERIVLMGGHMIPGKADPEWNTLCDPRASQIVFRAPKPVTMVGLDVTLKCEFTQDDLDTVAAKGTPLAQSLIAMTSLWQNGTHHLPIIHDPLAALVCVEPEVVTFERRKVRVDDAGSIVPDEQNGTWVDVAVDVRPEVVRQRVVELAG